MNLIGLLWMIAAGGVALVVKYLVTDIATPTMSSWAAILIGFISAAPAWVKACLEVWVAGQNILLNRHKLKEQDRRIVLPTALLDREMEKIIKPVTTYISDTREERGRESGR
jgi:hypothetical protein